MSWSGEMVAVITRSISSGCQAGVGQSLPGREDAQIGGADTRLGDPPLADARPLPDPLVGGVEAGGEIVVGDDLLGDVGAKAGDGDRSPQEGSMDRYVAWVTARRPRR